MRHSIYIPITALFIAMLCVGTQCNKEDIVYQYSFIEKIDLFPSQKSYHLGDTIWLQYVNPNKRLFDHLTRQYILADTVAITLQVAFNSRYNAPFNPADGYCDYVSSYGTNVGRYLDTNGSGLLLEFGCSSNNSYDFKIGLVLKEKGIYSLDLAQISRSVAACTNRISAFPLSTIMYRFNVADGNKDIFLSIPPDSRGESVKGFTENKIDNKETYIVQVE